VKTTSSRRRVIRVNRKMTQGDIEAAVKLINEWSTRLPRTPLVWSQVEQRTGFTRPALAAKEEIQRAYDAAKAEKRKFNGTPAEFKKLTEDVERLVAENKRLQKGESEWQTTWQRVLHHLSELGIDPKIVLAPIGSAGRRHTGETLAAIRGERQAKYPRAAKGRAGKRNMDDEGGDG